MHLCMVKAVRLRNVAKRNGGQEEAISMPVTEWRLASSRNAVEGGVVIRSLTRSDEVKSFSFFNSRPHGIRYKKTVTNSVQGLSENDLGRETLKS